MASSKPKGPTGESTGAIATSNHQKQGRSRHVGVHSINLALKVSQARSIAAGQFFCGRSTIIAKRTRLWTPTILDPAHMISVVSVGIGI